MSSTIQNRLNEQEEQRLLARTTDYRYREDWDTQTFLVGTLHRILLLPWDSAWSTILLISGVVLLVCYCSCLNYYLQDKLCWNQGNVVLVLETLWVFDISVTVASRTFQYIWKDHFRNMQIPMQNFGNRPISIIVIETISVLPIGNLVAAIMTIDRKTEMLVRVFRGSLKIIRVIHTFWFSLSSVSYNLIILLTFLFIMKSLICILLVCTIIVYCMRNNILDLDVPDLLYNIVALINSSGSSYRPTYFAYWPIIGVLLFIPMYWFLTLYFGMGKITVSLMMLYHTKFNYMWARNATMRNLEALQIRQQCSKEIQQYWNIVWNECRGNSGFIADSSVPYSPPLLMQDLPPAMAKGISADIGFQALNHASLFKEMDLAFLREVSARFKQRNYLAGQYIFHRKELKDALVYVSQGVIELLSEEDAETPILSLTSGSVLCETTVIFPTKSLVNVKCRTDCQIQVLRRTDLLNLASDFKKSYCKLIARSLDRMQEASKFKVLEDEVRLSYHPNSRRSLSVMWIAKTLHRLMKLEFTKASRDYIHDNIYLERDMDESSYRRLLFNADYIEMLCLKRHAYHDDSVFVRLDGWYFILQPNSFLAYIWEGMIVLLAMFTAILMPYAVLVSGVVESEWYKVMLLSITMIWILDLFVLLKISVQTKQEKLETSIDILSYHLLTVSYYFDILSALPIEAVAAMCVSDRHIRDIASLNRVIKIWRLANILYKYGERPGTNSLKIHMYILLLFFIYLIYFVACVLYALEGLKTADFYEVFYDAAQMLTGHTMTYITEKRERNFITVSVILSFLSWYIHNILFMMNLTRGILFAQFKRSIHCHLRQTAHVIKPFMQMRCCSYIETQMNDNLGAAIVRLAKPAQASFMDMPRPMKTSILYHVLSNCLSKHPLFRNVLGSWMLKVCSVAKIQVIHPREPLFRCGDITKHIYILIGGRCKVFDCLDKDKPHNGHYIKPGNAINEIEVIFKKPLHRTIVTESHCRFAVLNYHEMSDIMIRRQMDLCILQTMEEFRNDPYLQKHYNYVCTKMHKDERSFAINQTAVSFVRHAFESDEHLRMYRGMGIFGTILQNVMMNTTITPDGVFLHRWEVIRSTGLLLSVVLFINPEAFYSSKSSDRLFLIMLFFDLWTLVDIYIRFHIGYFNENGILISHPLLTAKYYFTRAFFIDLLPLIPIRYLVEWETFPQIVLFCHFVHLLQLYRYWYFIRTLDVSYMNRMKLVKGLPLLFIIICVGCTILLHVNCSLVIGNWGDAYFECKNNSLFVQNELSKKHRQYSVTFMYSLYVVTSLLTQCNLQGFRIESYFDAVFVTIGSICGLIVRMAIFSFIALHYYGKNREDSLANIDYADQLNKFMKSEGLSNSLKNAVLTHYNAVRLMPLSIHKTSEYMPRSIRRDVIFEKLAPKILNANFLNGVKNGDVFLRNILPLMTRSYLSQGLFLLRVDDVVSNIWLIFDGIVNVIAADESTHVTYLGPGSLIGNLQQTQYCRTQYMFFAETMLETYTIPTDIFYRFLSNFPDTENHYNQLKYINRNFIKTNKIELQLIERYNFEKSKMNNGFYSKWKNLVIPATKLWYILLTIISVSVVYLDILLVAVSGLQDDRAITCIHDVVTFLYVINLIILPKVDFNPYSCSMVHKITNLSIKANYLMYIIWIAAAVPYKELQVFWIKSKLPIAESFALTIVLGNFKFFRLSWIKYISYYYGGIMGIHIYLFKYIFNAAVFVLVIILTAETFIVAGGLITPNMNPPIELDDLPFTEHFTFVLKWIEFGNDMLTHSTQGNYYPVGPFFAFACTIIMFLFLVASVFFVVDIVFTQLESQIHKALDAQNLYKLQFFMRAWEVNEYMVARVVRYTHERYIGEVKLKIPPSILENAPLQLKVSIMDACYGELLEINSVFSHCHIHFLRQLSQHFQPFCYYPDDYIQYQGSMEPIMYFVHRGVVEELSEHDLDGCKRHRYITKAQTFGELQGFNIRSPMRHSYRATTPSIVLSLEYSSWSHMLDLFPASKAIITMQLRRLMRIRRERRYNEIII